MTRVTQPDNILLHHDADGKLRLKLADWGYAQVPPPARELWNTWHMS